MTRELINSPVRQGVVEKRAYQVRALPGSAPASVDITVIREQDNTDVTDDTTEGAPSVSGSIITTCLIKSLGVAYSYRVNVKWNEGAEVIERYLRILVDA